LALYYRRQAEWLVQSTPTSSISVVMAGKPTDENFITKWGYRLVLLWFTYAVCKWLDKIKDSWYVLNPTLLHGLAKDAIAVHGDNMDGIIRHIVTNLTAEFPQFPPSTSLWALPFQKAPSSIVLNTNSSEWVFNNAGGAMGAMYIIHASVTEYLIIFGTPLGTEGHSGLHTADDYFHILQGEQWAFEPGELTKTVYGPGDVNFMRRGVARQYKMHEGCWALEYARGWIPLMLPFGYADALSSTLDYVTLYRTTVWTAREIIKNLLVGKI